MPCTDLHFTVLVMGRLLLALRNKWDGEGGKVLGHSSTTLSFDMTPIVRFLATEAENLTDSE